MVAANPAAAKLAMKQAHAQAHANAHAHGAVTTTTVTATPAAPSKPTIYIQKIPPFRGKRSEPSTSVSRPASAAETSPGAGGSGSVSAGGLLKAANGSANGQGETTTPSSPTSATSASFKLNVKASSFKPNVNAPAFKPVVGNGNGNGNGNAGGSPPAAGTSGALSRQESKSEAPNHPFFGKTVIKMTPVHIKDEFNPFRHAKVPEASSIGEHFLFSCGSYPV